MVQAETNATWVTQPVQWLQVLSGWLKPRGHQYTPFGRVRASISKSVSPWTCL